MENRVGEERALSAADRRAANLAFPAIPAKLGINTEFAPTRHPGATRQQARGHHPGATKPTSGEKLARAREFMAQGSSALEAAKRAGISRETLTRELQSDPNIVKLGGRYVDRKIVELLRYRQQLGAVYKDKFENVEEFFAARPLPEQIDDLEEAKRLHREWLDNGQQPLGRFLNMYLAYHTTI